MLGKFAYAAVTDAGDREVQAARDAFERRNMKALSAAREAFKAAPVPHILAPYVEQWWLVASLAPAGGARETAGIASAADFREFLDRHRDAPVADTVRREWLRALAREERWDLFVPEAARLNADDRDITCHLWRHRLAQGDREAVGEARALWAAAQSAPDSCYDAWTAIADEIPTESKWKRVRALLAAGQLADARRSAAYIAKLPAKFERTTATVGIETGRYLQREKPDPKSRASLELWLFAVTKMAKSDAAIAAGALDRHAALLSAADREYAWAQVALYGAMQHAPQAMEWFARAGSHALDDNQAAWKVRAALRAGDWVRVKSAIEGMGAMERRDGAWRYWLARAEDQQGNTAAALKLREALARENHFYGILAAEELGTASPPPFAGWKPTPAELDAVRRKPAIQRALALYALDLRNEGLREWLYAVRGMSDQDLLCAAQIAAAAGVPDRAISTAERTLLTHDFTLRFPMPYREPLVAQSTAQGLDPAWVYGLIRQESRFVTDARSRVGAAGLMQLMPATARWVAKKTGMQGYSTQRVTDVPVNLALGAFYLRHVLDDLGHPVLATAAYNAGPGRARRWRADGALEGAVYAESIPFTETRDYVKKVMANAWYYAHQSGATQVSLTRMVGKVPGKQAGELGATSLGAPPPPAPATTASLDSAPR